MAWNKRPKAERPEYPKLVPIIGTAEAAQTLLSSVRGTDPQAELVNGGERGLYLRVHNEAAETYARLAGETRSFPLA